jgi:hypothetical protein
VHVWAGPRVQLPNRDYFLYEGPVEAVTAPTRFSPGGQTANLWWPSDRAWAVASEIDLAWTYVAGPAELVDALVADDRIEALRAGRDDLLSRVEGWVERWVDDALDELLTAGTATIETSRGTVQAYLRRPTWSRTGELLTDRTGDSGGHGSTRARLHRCGEDEMRQVLKHFILWEVIALVGGQ